MAKVWLATGGFLLALGQLSSAPVMLGKVPHVVAPPWIGTAHRWRDLAGWALPVAGSLVFTGLVMLWLTSSLWFFTTIGIRI